MFFLIFAIVALILTLTPRRFRKIGFAVVGVLFVVFLTIVLLNRKPVPEPPPATAERKDLAPERSRKFDFDQYRQEKKDRADPEAKTRIALAEVRFDQVQPISGLDTGTIRSVHARIYNDSTRYALTDYSYYLGIQDCLSQKSIEKPGAECTTVYDQRDTVSLTVPAQQARDVVIEIPRNPDNSSAPFKLLGSARIELTPTDVRAYQSQDPD